MAENISASELTPELLLKAYAAGVFPMAESAEFDEVVWIDPSLRGVIPLNEFHAPSRLLRTVRRGAYDVTIDENFEAVLDGCAERETTWINPEIRRLYVGLMRLGYAHSIEIHMNGKLAGGLYGVKLGGAFFGESMFSHARDASKIAMVHLVARLKAGGFQLLDTQFVTEHLAQFGARSVSRRRYHRLLELAIMAQARFPALPADAPCQDVAQLSTQISYR